MKKTAAILVLFLAAGYGLWQLSDARTWQVAGELVHRVERPDSLVALTFDDGPSPAFTDTVLALLQHYGVPATFFLTGREMEAHPREARKIVDAGHQLGNHSYSHRPMLMVSAQTVEKELSRTDRAIRAAGYRGPIQFRPPYGKKLFTLPWVLDREERTTVTWDVEPESYPEVASSARNIAEHVIQRVRPGSIILLHLMYTPREESRRALPLIISSLRARGYRFVTVEELMNRPVFKAPVSGGTMVSAFGERYRPGTRAIDMHEGVDYFVPAGTKVLAAASGTVQALESGESCGIGVVVDHGSGYRSRYCHLSRIANGVQMGSVLEAGELLGYSGRSGEAAAAHLHVELHRDGNPVDPARFFSGKRTGHTRRQSLSNRLR